MVSATETIPAHDVPPKGPRFGLMTATFVVVSSMIGTGVLTTSGFTVYAVGSNQLMLVLWVVGGDAKVAAAHIVHNHPISCTRRQREGVRVIDGGETGRRVEWTRVRTNLPAVQSLRCRIPWLTTGTCHVSTFFCSADRSCFCGHFDRMHFRHEPNGACCSSRRRCCRDTA